MDTIVLDGFAYEIETAQLIRMENGHGGTRQVKVLRMTDHERGITVEAYFPVEAFGSFIRDAQAEQVGLTARVGR